MALKVGIMRNFGTQVLAHQRVMMLQKFSATISCETYGRSAETRRLIGNFSRFTNALKNRKLEYSERKRLKFPVEIMYNVVEDVDHYSDFVPWCKKSEVFMKSKSLQKARLEVGFGKVTEKYNSSITCIRPHLVKAVCTDGILFNSLQCTWRFAPGKVHNSCIIDFHVSFEFRSLIYSQLANMVFNETVKTMVKAFETRARAIQNEERMEENKILKEIAP